MSSDKRLPPTTKKGIRYGDHTPEELRGHFRACAKDAYKNRKAKQQARIDKLLELSMEVAGLPPLSVSHRTHLSYLAAGLWTATKGTRMEANAKDLIEQIYPEFFQD